MFLYQDKETKDLQWERAKLYTPSADYHTGEMAEDVGVFRRR